MKKILSVLLAAVMVVFSLPVAAFADDVLIFTEDATACEFLITPDKSGVRPGEAVNYSFSVRPNGKIYGLQARLALPEGFSLVEGSGTLADGVKDSLGWDDLAVTETNGTLIFTGFTALNPYDRNAELKIAEFSCNIADGTQSGTVSLEKYFVLDSRMAIPPMLIENFSKVDVIYEAENVAASCTFKLTADKTDVEPGDTVNFVFSLIPDGKIYAFQAYLELPGNFSYVKKSGKLVDGVKDFLDWDDVAVTETKDGRLLFSGYTADKPYSRTNELKLAAFSCMVGENANTGTVSLTNYFALDNEMNKLADMPGEFPEIKVGGTRHIITIPENVSVTRGGEKLTDGAEIFTGNVLTITANTPGDHMLGSLTVNGTAFSNGGEFTVGKENVVIKAEFTEIGHYTITIRKYVTVTCDGVVLTNGDEITTGDVLTITANTPSGYRLNSIFVNGKEIKDGGTYTVTSEDVVVAADFWKIVQFTVTIPANVSVTRGGMALTNGASVSAGDILTITANTPSGYRLSSLSVNGKSISNGSTYTVGSENVIIAVNFSKISTGGSSSGSGGSGGSGGSSRPSYRTITIPENVVVTKSGTALADGDIIYSYDEIRIEANVPDGKKLVSLTVNGTEVKSGDVYTVGTGNVIIAVSFEDIAAPARTVIIPAGAVVTHNGINIINGAKVSEGDILVISANVPDGYKLNSLAVNGKEIPNKGIYTVSKDNLIITVDFEKIPDDKTNEPFIISNPDKRGWKDISEILSTPSDKTFRIDMNGTTVLPGNVLQIIKNNGNKLLLRMDEKITWTIGGKDVGAVDHDIDLKVTLGTSGIPGEAIKGLVGKRDYLTFTLEHNGDFGFNALLAINVGTQYNDEKADLYCFNDNEFKSEGRCDILYGMAILQFTHASDWIVVFGESEDDSNSNNSNSGTSKPDIALPNDPEKDDPNKNNSSTSTSNSNSGNDKENPVTGASRVSLPAFLALVTSAAISLVTRKRKQ